MGCKVKNGNGKNGNNHKNGKSNGNGKKTNGNGRGPGQPPKILTPEQIEQVKLFGAGGVPLEIMADYFGIGDRTLRTRIQEDPEILAAYKKGKATMALVTTGKIGQGIRDGDRVLMMFYAKCQLGWRETTRLEHSGPDGQPLIPESMNKLEEYELRNLVKAAEIIANSAEQDQH